MFDEINKYKINLWFSGDITITSNHRRNTENIRRCSSNTRNGYFIKKSTRRNLISSAFFLFLIKQHNIIFFTLTLPYKPKKGEKFNPALNRFLTNMRKNYGLKNYIWTRENTKAGRPHWHILADIPYVPIQKINNAWCEAINSFSKNAVRLPANSKSIVSDLERSMKYITKYITKDETGRNKPNIERHPERCYAISSECNKKPVRIDWFELKQIQADHGKDLKYRVFEHCTTVKIWDFFKKSDYFCSYLADITENTENSTYQKDAIGAIESDQRPANSQFVGPQLFLFKDPWHP